MSINTLVTADDFGFTSNINRAIIDTYEKHRVTELSLMVDSYGTTEAVTYIREHNVIDVGLHFSLCRLSRDGKILQGSEYDPILAEWTTEQLAHAFDEEVKLFEEQVGFIPKHVIGHKQIALHHKLVNHVAAYCQKNSCYARKQVSHPTLRAAEIPSGLSLGRTVDEIFTYRYGNPEQMLQAYTQDIEEAKQQKAKQHATLHTIEFVFHPGYATEFEKSLTSFIQERIDDVNFLLSDAFLQLIEKEDLRLVSSSQV